MDSISDDNQGDYEQTPPNQDVWGTYDVTQHPENKANQPLSDADLEEVEELVPRTERDQLNALLPGIDCLRYLGPEEPDESANNEGTNYEGAEYVIGEEEDTILDQARELREDLGEYVTPSKNN